MALKIVAISDTHNDHKRLVLPDGDMLIHAGDFTGMGTKKEVKNFVKWWRFQDYKYKILIPGNHDFRAQKRPEHTRATVYGGCTEPDENWHYLVDQSVVIEGIKFYGSPWQPWFHDWAFNLQRGAEIREKWDLIPKDTDVLITHGPAYGYGDRVAQTFLDMDRPMNDSSILNQRKGCEELAKVIKLINPKYHIFGHIHEDYGMFNQYKEDETTYINASSCGGPGMYRLIANKPIVFEI